MRALRLSLLLMRRSPLRAVMLTVMVAVAIVVFALVTELSRVSQQGLDDAIVRDAGMQGSYEVTLRPELGLDRQQADDMIDRVAASEGMRVWARWQDLPPVTSECPPYGHLGEQQLRVLRRGDGSAYPLPWGQVYGLDLQWCIDGQRIPASALYLAGPDEQSVFGQRLYVRPEYENLIVLSTVAPLTRGYTLVSGEEVDSTESLRGAIVSAANPIVVSSDVDPGQYVTVARLDREGANARAASRGVAVTYGVIGWGVLILAGLGLAVVQTMSARQRSWFYGLARALGATDRRVVAVQAIDTFVVVATGTALAVFLLWAGGGTVHDFAATAFGADAHTLSAPLLGNLLAGTLVLLALTTAVPAAQTLRRDPVAVLEAPRD